MTATIAVHRYAIDQDGRGEPHQHDDHQLVWSPSDTLTVDVDGRCWILPPTLALFVPAGVVHATSAPRRSMMAGIHLDPDHSPLDWLTPVVIAMHPLLRDLVLWLEAGERDGSMTASTREHAETLAHDLFEPVSIATIHVPMPTDGRANAVACAIIRRPGDDRSLERWASEVGSSVRTLSRLFSTETGMSFVQWRAHARVRSSITMLADGAPIKVVARSVGYSSPSAFIAVFGRVTGQTPGSYFPSSW